MIGLRSSNRKPFPRLLIAKYKLMSIEVSIFGPLAAARTIDMSMSNCRRNKACEHYCHRTSLNRKRTPLTVPYKRRHMVVGRLKVVEH